MKDIKIGFIGLGGRGYGLMTCDVLGQGEQITAVCDVYEDRAERGADAVEKAGQKRPAADVLQKFLRPFVGGYTDGKRVKPAGHGFAYVAFTFINHCKRTGQKGFF